MKTEIEINNPVALDDGMYLVEVPKYGIKVYAKTADEAVTEAVYQGLESARQEIERRCVQ